MLSGTLNGSENGLATALTQCTSSGKVCMSGPVASLCKPRCCRCTHALGAWWNAVPPGSHRWRHADAIGATPSGKTFHAHPASPGAGRGSESAAGTHMVTYMRVVHVFCRVTYFFQARLNAGSLGLSLWLHFWTVSLHALALHVRQKCYY